MVNVIFVAGSEGAAQDFRCNEKALHHSSEFIDLAQTLNNHLLLT